MDIAIRSFGEWNKGLRTIAADLSDDTKRLFEDSAATLEKLLSAKSVEHLLEIHAGYTKRACDGYLHQWSKIGGKYAELLKETCKPLRVATRLGLIFPLRTTLPLQAAT